jgi:hypothetical protein
MPRRAARDALKEKIASITQGRVDVLRSAFRSAGLGYLTFQVGFWLYAGLTLLLGLRSAGSTEVAPITAAVGALVMIVAPCVVAVVAAWRATRPPRLAWGLVALVGVLAVNAALMIPSPVSESVGIALFYGSIGSPQIILAWIVIGWAAVCSLLLPSRWRAWQVLAVSVPVGYLLTFPYGWLLDLLMRDTDHWGIAAGFFGPLPVITTIVWYVVALAWLRRKRGEMEQPPTAPDETGPAPA